jgi:hypothetical protein
MALLALLGQTAVAEPSKTLTLHHLQREEQIQGAELEKVVSNIFARHDMLFVAESQHFYQESYDVLTGLAEAGMKSGCRDLMLEASPVQGMLESDYVDPARHERVKAFQHLLEPGDLPMLETLYALNQRTPAGNRVRLHGIEGYMATPEDVLGGWRYFLAALGTSPHLKDIRQLVAAANPDRQSILRLRDHVLRHEATLRRQLSPADTERFELLREALDDVFMRDDINQAFSTNFVKGATLREDSSLRHLRAILARHPGRKYMALYGGWHVERRKPGELLNLFTALNEGDGPLKGRLYSVSLRIDAVDLLSLEPSTDYASMYWVYAATLKKLHAYKEAHPDARTMPFALLTGSRGSQAWDPLAAKMDAARPTWFDGGTGGIFEKFDAALMFPVGHYLPKR